MFDETSAERGGRCDPIVTIPLVAVSKLLSLNGWPSYGAEEGIRTPAGVTLTSV